MSRDSTTNDLCQPVASSVNEQGTGAPAAANLTVWQEWRRAHSSGGTAGMTHVEPPTLTAMTQPH